MSLVRFPVTPRRNRNRSASVAVFRVLTRMRLLSSKQIKETLTKIKATTGKYPPKSQMYKAANYMLNQWDGLEAIPTGGDYSWDNNLIERINRYVSLPRRNSLFFGSHAGAKRGCFFYSLACSCRLHRINFFEYLSDILNRAEVLQRTASLQAYRDILPDRWKKNEQGQ